MDIDTLFKKNENELLFELGKNLISEPEEKQIIPDVGKYINTANSWISENKNKLSSVVCELEIIKKICCNDEQEKNKIEAATALADLLAGLLIGIPPFTVSVLIVKYYAKKWCKNLS